VVPRSGRIVVVGGIRVAIAVSPRSGKDGSRENMPGIRKEPSEDSIFLTEVVIDSCYICVGDSLGRNVRSEIGLARRCSGDIRRRIESRERQADRIRIRNDISGVLLSCRGVDDRVRVGREIPSVLRLRRNIEKYRRGGRLTEALLFL